MAGDDGSRERLEKAAEKNTHHIVDHSELAEEEESTKKRQKVRSPQTKSPGRSPGGDASSRVPGGDEAADASRRRADDPLTQRLRAEAAKMAPTTPAPSRTMRRAEDSPDDPRRDDGKAEVAYDNVVKDSDDTAMNDADRDDSSRDVVEKSKSPESGMVDSIDVKECNHCGRELASRNLLFEHLYQNNDAAAKDADLGMIMINPEGL